MGHNSSAWNFPFVGLLVPSNLRAWGCLRPFYQISVIHTGWFLQTNIWMNISDGQTLVQPQYLQRQQLHPLKFWLTLSRLEVPAKAVVVAIWSLNDAVSFESLDLLLRRTFFESTGAGYLSISFQHLHLARSSGQLLAWVRSIHGWCFLTWNKTFKARRKSCQIAPRMGGGVL